MAYAEHRAGERQHRLDRWLALSCAEQIAEWNYLPDCDILCVRFCWLRSMEMIRSQEKPGSEVEIICGRNTVGEKGGGSVYQLLKCPAMRL